MSAIERVDIGSATLYLGDCAAVLSELPPIDFVMRRYLFKLQPSPAQEAALQDMRRLHCDLYNALLQQRIEAYRRAVNPLTGKGRSLTYYDQCKELTALRADDWRYRALSSASMAVTAQRVDNAMKAFFRRAKSGAGAASGFPRFQAFDRFPGFGFKAHGSGWRWSPETAGAERWANGRLRLQAVAGEIRVRGRLPRGAMEIRTGELIWREERWWLSLAVTMAPRMAAATIDAAALRLRLNLITSFADLEKIETEEDGPRGAGADFILESKRISQPFQGCSGEPPEAPPEMGGERGDGDRLDQVVAPEAPPEMGGERGVLMLASLAPLPEAPPEMGGERGVRTLDRSGPAPEAPPEMGGERGIGVFGNVSIDPEAPPEMGGERAPPEMGRGISELQAAMAAARTERHWGRYRRLKGRKQRIEARCARQRREALHEWSTEVIRACRSLEVVAPESIRAVTASGAGDRFGPGAAVRLKAMLNRRILDFAPFEAIQQLTYKAAEGGRPFTLMADQSAPAQIGGAVVALTKTARKARKLKEKHHVSEQLDVCA